MKKVLDLINLINEKIVTHFACWLIFPLIFVTVYEVCARYLFNNPTNWAFDLSWMFCGTFVFLGGGYTLLHKGHVKVDLFYDRFPKRVQALINIVCYLVLFFPAYLVMSMGCYKSAVQAWKLNQRSPYTSWEPSIGPIKTILFIGILLFLVQGVADFINNLEVIKKGENKNNES